MKSLDDEKIYGDASELLQVVDIDGIRFFNLEAKTRAQIDDNNDAPEVFEADDSTETQESNQSWTFFIQVSPDTLNLRARLDVHGPDATYLVDAAVFYAIREPGEVPRNVVSEFVNRVAILALYPFIREALHELARKIDTKRPLLGLYHPGELSISLEDAEELS
jgi:hypothetical protein